MKKCMIQGYPCIIEDNLKIEEQDIFMFRKGGKYSLIDNVFFGAILEYCGLFMMGDDRIALFSIKCPEELCIESGERVFLVFEFDENLLYLYNKDCGYLNLNPNVFCEIK